ILYHFILNIVYYLFYLFIKRDFTSVSDQIYQKMVEYKVTNQVRINNQFVGCCPDKKQEIENRKEEYEQRNPGKTAFYYHCCSCYHLKMLKHIDPVECGEGTKFICQFCTTRLTKQQLNDKDNFKEQQQSIDKVESSDSNSE